MIGENGLIELWGIIRPKSGIKAVRIRAFAFVLLGARTVRMYMRKDEPKLSHDVQDEYRETFHLAHVCVHIHGSDPSKRGPSYDKVSYLKYFTCGRSRQR